LHILFTSPLKPKGSPRIFYGGARRGDIGGTLVKIKRLQDFFPQSPYLYNIVYSLSNAPYLSRCSLGLLSICKVPLVLNQNGVFYPSWYSGNWKKQNSIMSLAYHKADFVIWQSQFSRDCADHFLGRRSGPGEILFNAVDIDFFKPVMSTELRPFTFLVAGKTSKDLSYRLELAIESIALARKSGLNTCLLIAGVVHERARLQSLVESYSLTKYIHFLGPYSQQEAPLIFQSSDAYLSLTFQDVCPNSVIEAMSCGLPILYSSSGGVPELVGPDAGIGLHVPRDWSRINVPPVHLVVAAMFEIFRNSCSYSIAARKRALEHFNIRKWLTRHDEIFTALIASKSL